MGSSSPVSAPSPACGRGFEGDVAVGDPPPTLSLPLKGGGDVHQYPLPLEGGGLGWGWGRKATHRPQNLARTPAKAPRPGWTNPSGSS